LEVVPKVPLNHRDELSRAHMPGVAGVCLAIAKHPADVRPLTIKRSTVAVVTDGSAVLGLRDIEPAAALPVIEGKASCSSSIGGVDAWPVRLATKDVDEIVHTVGLRAPVYGGINLEEIAAPRCFEIERRLRERLDIPMFHDDQHGFAIVVLAALTNALRVVGKKLADIRVTLSGVGAAGTAIIKLLRQQGVGDLVACDRQGVVSRDRPGVDGARCWVAEHTNVSGVSGPLRAAPEGADVFLGVSAADLLSAGDISRLAEDPIVFAPVNPDPEVDPFDARKYAAILATGRSDLPSQISNVLAFPGVFRGLFDAGATEFTDEIELAAAQAIADAVGPEELNASYVVPSVRDAEVAPAVAAAVRSAAEKT